MIDRAALLADLRVQLKRLEADLAERADSAPDMVEALDAEYRGAREAGRTGETFSQWRASALTQAGVAWLLGCVFVRFVEDNELIDAPLIAGPHERNAAAAERQTAYFRERPTESDRDYLLDVFAEVERLPAMAKLFDRAHNPVWRLGISGDAARDLLAFWRAVDPDTGSLVHDFTDPEWDTRFLGDLYQDLSEDAKKRYALLQTPEFVEEFILDHTLDPAVKEFGLTETRLLDPTCGSGHFLIGAFRRLMARWIETEPATSERVLVQRSLDSVSGIDLNPFAIAIARFRLLMEAIRACGVAGLANTPAFRLSLAVGDSLLHGRRFDELQLGSGAEQLAARGEFGHAFVAEDLEQLDALLGRQYAVVVGNPPYVTVKDKAVNALYRQRYAKTCYRQYSLGVPFTERFFDLAMSNRGQPAGYVGLITANSFMKREFGKRLIEEFLAHVDLTHLIDTSGAYIPGHGTPTVALLGRSRRPSLATVRAVLGVKGEPTTPMDPKDGQAWLAIVEQVDRPNSESEWVSVVDIDRQVLSTHPWSLLLAGGGADQLKSRIELADSQLSHEIAEIGRTTHTGDDFAFYLKPNAARTSNLAAHCVELVVGEDIREWNSALSLVSVFPYEKMNGAPWVFIPDSAFTHFWKLRVRLKNRRDFGRTIEERGLRWWEHSMFFRRRYLSRLSIPFAFVATHNHFVLDRGGKVFNQSAPVIKLPEGATEDDHLGLVGLLNSSVACFWMKQVFHNKGEGGGTRVDAGHSALGDEAWKSHYEFTGTGLKKLPLPPDRPLDLARILDTLATERQSHLPAALTDNLPTSRADLDAHRDTVADLLSRMIALQEELDWQCYALYGIADDLSFKAPDGTRAEPPAFALGERAFEIVMARQMTEGELETTWFERHGSTPITELPEHWPGDYRALVERRIALIESDRFVGLLEKPEHKRRWNTESWHDQEQRALRGWLLDRLETPAYWPDTRLASTQKLADRAATDTDFQQIASLYVGHEGTDLASLIATLVEDESVPALPLLRYKRSGLDKRADWEGTWAKQREEDTLDVEIAAETPQRDGEPDDDYAERLNAAQRKRKQQSIGDITPPPKYRSADFQKNTFWLLRGALDVPKERFVSFPHLSRDTDPSLLVGWAGWNALELCQAVAAYLTEVVEQDGWPPERLTPLLAALKEQLPWMKQWHNNLDPVYNQRLGDFFETFLHTQLATHGLTEDSLNNWQPPQATRRSRRRTA